MNEIMAVAGFLALLALLIPKLRWNQQFQDQDLQAGTQAVSENRQAKRASSNN